MCQEKNYTFRYLARNEKCEQRLPECRSEISMDKDILKVSLSWNNLVNQFTVMKSPDKSVAEARKMILSWTENPKQVSGLLLESQSDFYATSGDNKESTEKLLETLDDDKKATMLSLMICRFIETLLSLRPEDDRDCLCFKRVHTPADIVYKYIVKRINRFRMS
jgi:DNA-directed RNA polymerase beta subunit